MDIISSLFRNQDFVNGYIALAITEAKDYCNTLILVYLDIKTFYYGGEQKDFISN